MKKIFLLIALIIIALLQTLPVAANHLPSDAECDPATPHCQNTLNCQFFSPLGGGSSGMEPVYRCQIPITPTPTITPTPRDFEKVIGKVKPPIQIINIGYGGIGISNFLNTIINLLYIVAALVFVFMVLISAFQWIVSGGDKEKIGAARQRLTWAIIGISSLALAFLVIRVIGNITGFTFFTGQGSPLYIPSTAPNPGQIIVVPKVGPFEVCIRDGVTVGECDKSKGYECKIDPTEDTGIGRRVFTCQKTTLPPTVVVPQPTSTPGPANPAGQRGQTRIE